MEPWPCCGFDDDTAGNKGPGSPSWRSVGTRRWMAAAPPLLLVQNVSSGGEPTDFAILTKTLRDCVLCNKMILIYS